MHIEDITMTMFAACNGIRVVAYVPQIYKAFNHQNGTSAISGMTWGLFFIANVSTVAYAIVNRSDYWLAACFGLNAVCCAAILLAAYRGALHLRLSWGAARGEFEYMLAFGQYKGDCYRSAADIVAIYQYAS
jgi:hypothetical protein